jgi:hypothetical protein
MKRLLVILAAGALLGLIPAAVSGATDEVFTGTFTGAQEAPPVSTSAGGTVYVFINPAATEIKYAVSYTGLSGSLLAAHIHYGVRGVSGQIMFPLAAGPSTMFGSLTAANFQTTTSAPKWADALNAIRSGKAYVNLHTAAHPTGEVRANLKPAASAATPSPTATPKATAQPTARPTARPTATARATTQPVHRSLPPTSTTTPTGRQAATDLLPVLLLLVLVGVGGGLFATWKVRPRSTPPDDF